MNDLQNALSLIFRTRYTALQGRVMSEAGATL